MFKPDTLIKCIVFIGLVGFLYQLVILGVGSDTYVELLIFALLFLLIPLLLLRRKKTALKISLVVLITFFLFEAGITLVQSQLPDLNVIVYLIFAGLIFYTLSRKDILKFFSITRRNYLSIIWKTILVALPILIVFFFLASVMGDKASDLKAK